MGNWQTDNTGSKSNVCNNGKGQINSPTCDVVCEMHVVKPVYNDHRMGYFFAI